MPPKFLSLEFHLRFFPALLWSRLRPQQRQGTGFAPLSPIIIVFACILLVILGIPYAMSHGSVIGWILSGVGLAGIVALFINSIFSRSGPPSYDGFLAGIFFFFISLGITSGVFIGALERSFALGLLAGAGGFVAGYGIGIFAGLWLQYLGWMADLLNGISYLAILGMFVVDLVLLAG
jgi:hypothetical protein